MSNLITVAQTILIYIHIFNPIILIYYNNKSSNLHHRPTCPKLYFGSTHYTNVENNIKL